MKAKEIEIRGHTIEYWKEYAKKKSFGETPINALKYITVLEEVIQIYARIQIEKDRERINKSLNNCGEQYCIDFEIDETPIILD